MNYHNITKEDMLNGDGLRVVLWVSGCNHHCKGCQNPITWDEKGGLPFDEDAEKELFEALDKSYIDGITFSGGDPLFPANRSEVFRLIKKCKSLYPQKTIWLYTGWLWEEVSHMEIMKYIDVLVDGPYIEDKKNISLRWRGSENQRVIDVRQSLANKTIILLDDC